MSITTKDFQIFKEKERIKKIDLIYDITIGDTASYENKVEIIIK